MEIYCHIILCFIDNPCFFLHLLLLYDQEMSNLNLALLLNFVPGGCDITMFPSSHLTVTCHLYPGKFTSFCFLPQYISLPTPG